MKSNENWSMKRLGEILEINPTTRLSKGSIAKKVGMEYLTEFVKKIQGYEITEFKSGSKFKNSDTLFARITPCLENGKTAFVDILDEGEVAFGSTEFFVMRAIEGEGDPKFIYYLATSDVIRTIAIKSMTGTSGRQRAQKEALLEYSLLLPDIKEQKKIGMFLALFDEKIEVNKEIILNLEELSQAIFKQWFIDFEFPNEVGLPYRSSGGNMVESELGVIPEGWKIFELKELTQMYKKTFNPKKTNEEKVMHFSLPAFDTKSYAIVDKVTSIKSNKWIVEDNCVLFSKMNPSTPRIWLPPIDKELLNVASSEFVVLKNDSIDKTAFIYNLCKSEPFIDYLKANATGSTNSRQRITPDNAMLFKVALDSQLVVKYGELVKSLMEQVIHLLKENNRLEELRDTLLSKLLSGEIEIPDESVVDLVV